MNHDPLLDEFVTLFDKVEEMSNNFDRSNLQEITRLCDKMHRKAVDIIRDDSCAIKFPADKEVVTLVINEKDYELPLDDIVTRMETQEMLNFMTRRKDAIKEEEKKNKREDKENMNTANVNNDAMQSAFASFTQFFMAPFIAAGQKNAELNSLVQLPEKKETTLLEDINEIQKKVILLDEKCKNSEKLQIKIDELEAAANDVEMQINALKKEKEEMEELWSAAVEENDAIRGELSKLSEIKDSLNKEIEELKTKNAELEASVSEEKPEETNEEIKALKARNSELEELLSSAEGKLISMTTEMSSLTNGGDIESLKAEVKKYKELAYSDVKYNVMNANAYHDFLSTCDKDKVTVIVCSICNTKQINTIYSREHGDRVISIVASNLSELFGKENVYRVYGDQFFVMMLNSDSSNIKAKLENLKDELFKDLISIAFGVIDAVTCKDIATAIKHAEGDMKGMKAKSGQKQVVARELMGQANQNDNEIAESTDSDPEAVTTEKVIDDDIDVLSKTEFRRINETEPSSDYDDLFNAF